MQYGRGTRGTARVRAGLVVGDPVGNPVGALASDPVGGLLGASGFEWSAGGEGCVSAHARRPGAWDDAAWPQQPAAHLRSPARSRSRAFAAGM